MAGMDVVFAILLSAIAMSLIVGVRYLATSGGFAWLTGPRAAGAVRHAAAADRTRNTLVAVVGSDLRGAGGDYRLGLAKSQLDAHL